MGKKIHKKCSLKNKKNNFFIGEEMFYSKIKPLYKNTEFDINHLLEFEISLPFQMALDDNRLLSITKENCIIHYCYKQRECEEFIVERKEDYSIKKYYTSVIVAISCNFDIWKEDYKNIIERLFDYSIEELNKQIIAYVNCTKDFECFRITKEMFLPIVIMNLVNLEEGKSNKYIFKINMNVPYKKESLKYENLKEWIRIYNIYNENLNPLINSEYFVLKAYRNFEEGLYDEAVTSIQTSIETLIRIIYKEVLICNGISELEVENKLEDESFMGIIKKQLSKYIGGTWDVTRKESSVGNWYNNTYKIRNKIIHGGYFPTFKEANIAICAAMEFRTYLFKLVRKNKKRYVRLNKYFQ